MASELAAALAAVQAALPRVKKDKTAKVEHKAGGSHSYKYADLADVSAQVMPELGKHGLAFTSMPMLREDGRFVLRYRLIHESGEELTGDYPLPDSDKPQEIGGWITYARRYALGAVTGVATEEDTDGRSEPAKPQQQRKPRAEANGHTQLPKDAPGSAYTNQRGLITAVQIKYKELGFDKSEREQMLGASEQIIGRELTGPQPGRTHNNLSQTEAVKLRDTIGGFGDRGDLLAALVEATP